jgi:Fe-S cluster assembly protein SufD
MLQTTEKKVMPGAAQYLEKFEQLESPAQQPAWLSPLRTTGMASFIEQGFPTLKHEDWRFTNVAPIAALPFRPAREALVNGAEGKTLDEAVFTKLPGNRLVFVNGFFSAGLSRLLPVSGGVKI